MLERIAGDISRYSMFSPGARVGVAVSGGADSVCLLHALFELAPRWNLHLSVLHLEHGIRGETSRADADFVRGLAAGLGLAFVCRNADVPAIAQESRDNLEQAARRIRHEFFRKLVDADTVDRVATGHTRNDQAETVLYRILRGSGVSGLAGIRPTTTEGLVRPLLSLWRTDVESWLRERHIEWREDSTNADLTYTRNRIRYQLLPLLRADWNPRIDEVLARLAVLSAEDEQYWDGLLVELCGQDSTAAIQSAGGSGTRRRLKACPTSNTLEVRLIGGAPPALARRMVRRAIERVKGDLRQIDFAHIEAVMELAHSTEGSGRLQVPGVDILRSFDWIRFSRLGTAAEPRPSLSFPIWPPCAVEWPDSGRIVFEIRGNGPVRQACGKLEDGLDWPQVSALPEVRAGSLELRNWRPGDSYCPIGHVHERKIKQMFQDARVPLWQRRQWPVLAAGDRVLWSRQFGPAADVGVTPESASRLFICDTNVPVG